MYERYSKQDLEKRKFSLAQKRNRSAESNRLMVASSTKSSSTRIRSGVVVDAVGVDSLLVAVDFSNDVVEVAQSDVIMLFDRPEEIAGSRQSTNSPFINPSGFVVGAKVQFIQRFKNRRLFKSDESVPKYEKILIQVNVSEKSVNGLEMEGSHMKSLIISLVVGRGSRPVPACTRSIAIYSDVITRQLRLSLFHQEESFFGTFAARLFCNECKRGAWRSHNHLNSLRVLQHISRAEKQGELGGRGSVALSTLGTSHMTSFFANVRLGFYLGTFIRRFPSHPLCKTILECVSPIMEGSPSSSLLTVLELIGGYQERYDSTLRCGLHDLACAFNDCIAAWLQRTGVRVEELFASWYMCAGREVCNIPKSVELLHMELDEIVKCRQRESRGGGNSDVLRRDIEVSSVAAYKNVISSTQKNVVVPNDDQTVLLTKAWNLSSTMKRKMAAFDLQDVSVLEHFVRDHGLAHAIKLFRKASVHTARALSNAIRTSASNVGTIVSVFQVVQEHIISSVRDGRSVDSMQTKVYLDPVELPLEGAYAVSALQVAPLQLCFAHQLITATMQNSGGEFNSASLVEHNSNQTFFFAWDTCKLFTKSIHQSTFNLYTSSLEALQNKLDGPMPTVQVLHGITLRSYSAFSSNPIPPTLLFEWNSEWVSMRCFCANMDGVGMISLGKLFRVLASSLIDGVARIHSAGYVLRSLSLDSIFVDESVSRVRILPLPTLRLLPSSEQENRINNMSNDSFFDEYKLKEEEICAASKSHLSPCLALQSPDENAPHPSFQVHPDEDLFSLGVCLYSMAFGKPPPELEIYSFHGNVKALADFLLYELLDNDILCELNQCTLKESQFAQDSSPRQGRNISSKILFAVLDKIYGQEVCKLLKLYWTSFRYQSSKGFNLLSDSSAALLWEKWIHSFFVKLCSLPANEYKGLERKLLSICSASNKKESRSSILDTIRKAMKEEFNLRVTNQEVDLLLQSLSLASSPLSNSETDGGLSGGREKPFQQLVGDAMKFLVSTFSDIEIYGTLQNTVFAICQCLMSTTVNTAENATQVSAQNLRHMAMCNPNEGHSDSIFDTARSYFYRIRSDPNIFVNNLLLTPLIGCVFDILASCDNVNRAETAEKLDHQLYRTSLLHVCTMLNVVEEVLYLRSRRVNMMENSEGGPDDFTKGDYVNMLPVLLASGVDVQWVVGHANLHVLNCIMEGSFFPLLMMFSLRFLSTDAAHVIDEDSSLARSYGIHDSMSMGSMLLLRLSKFFENAIVCLNSMGRGVLHIKKKLTETGFVHNKGDEKDLMVNRLDRLLDERECVERLYFTLVASILMLCTGEEVMPSAYGQREGNLFQAYPEIYDGEHRESILPMALIGHHHWTAQCYKLFEPCLREMVAEDGRGSTRVGCSVQCLTLANRYQQLQAMRYHSHR